MPAPNATAAKQCLLRLGFPEREIAQMTPQQILDKLNEYEQMKDQVD